MHSRFFSKIMRARIIACSKQGQALGSRLLRRRPASSGQALADWLVAPALPRTKGSASWLVQPQWFIIRRINAHSTLFSFENSRHYSLPVRLTSPWLQKSKGNYPKKEEDLKQEIKETLEFLNLARDVAGEGVSCELPSGAGSISQWSKQ